MYKPPQRIPYRPSFGPAPSADEAQNAMLFSPIAFGPVRLAERSWVPAMVPWRATEDGVVNDDVLDWYARFARGRPGAIVVEATGIRDIPSGPLLRIGDGLRACGRPWRPLGTDRTVARDGDSAKLLPWPT